VAAVMTRRRASGDMKDEYSELVEVWMVAKLREVIMPHWHQAAIKATSPKKVPYEVRGLVLY
jgi:hypothetical protein